MRGKYALDYSCKPCNRLSKEFQNEQDVHYVLCFFFEDFEDIFWTLASRGFPSESVSVHNGRSNTSAAAAELAEFRKITTFKGKTQYLMNTLYQIK